MSRRVGRSALARRRKQQLRDAASVVGALRVHPYKLDANGDAVVCKNVIRVARWGFEPYQRLRSIIEEDAYYGVD